MVNKNNLLTTCQMMICEEVCNQTRKMIQQKQPTIKKKEEEIPLSQFSRKEELHQVMTGPQNISMLQQTKQNKQFIRYESFL